MGRCGTQKLRRLLNACYHRSTIIRLDSVTVPTMRKTGNPYVGRVTKRSTILGIIGNWIYEDAVNRQRQREGKKANFVAESPSWGTNEAGSPYRTNRDSLYLNVKVERCLSTVLCLDGVPATGDELAAIQTFIPAKTEAPKQALDKPIIYRSYKLESIVGLKIGGQEFRVKPRKERREK